MASAYAHDPFSAATAPLTFAAFLEKMRNPAASDIVKAIKAFLTEFAGTQPDAERDAERVQARCLRCAAPARLSCCTPLPCALLRC
jgi:hypothetical protein